MGRRIRLPAALAAGLLLGSAGPAAGATRVGVAHSRVIARTSPLYISYAVDLDQVTGGMCKDKAVPHGRNGRR